MALIKYLFFFALAVACAMAAETERTKKDVLLGYPGLGYTAGLYNGAYLPTAYSGYAGYTGYSALPTAYSAYSAYPTAYSGVYPYGYRSVVY